MIEGEHSKSSVRAMCEALGVSTSAYYAWRARPESDKQRADRRLLVEIPTIHRQSRETYGALRVHAELRARGTAWGKNRVARLMREHDIRARKPKRRRQASASSVPQTPIASNVLERAFAPEYPNQVWGWDMTYIATGALPLGRAGPAFASRCRMVGPAFALTAWTSRSAHIGDSHASAWSRSRLPLGPGHTVHVGPSTGRCCAATA